MPPERNRCHAVAHAYDVETSRVRSFAASPHFLERGFNHAHAVLFVPPPPPIRTMSHVFDVAFAMFNNAVFALQYAFWTRALEKDLRWSEAAASSTACFLVYMLDRMVPSGGDDPSCKMRRMSNGVIPRVVAPLAVVLFVAACVDAPHMIVNTAIAIPFGAVYTFDLLGVKRAFLCSKNLYVAFMWWAWFFGASRSFPPRTEREAAVGALYMLHMVVSNVIMDVKDIEGDRASGILTLPVVLGAWGTKRAVVVSLALLAWIGSHVTFTLPVAYAMIVAALWRLDLEDGMQATVGVLALMCLPQCADMACSASLGASL